MSKNLVIVESPAKAKTIQKFLGADFVVESSFGHIADLPKKGMGIELDNNFKPTYEVSEDKKELVKKLKKIAKSADMVWLASDEDREGEAISWHLYNELDLTPAKTKRIVFHEITKNAILKAIDNPRQIDINLVNAQQARRILDRIVGFEVSPILWKKVKMGLSAGRVQSVATRLVVDKENDIIAFKPEAKYKFTGHFLTQEGKNIKTQLNHEFESLEDAENYLTKCVDKAYNVVNIEKKPAKRSPSAPFTTSTLQQEAARKIGLSVSRTMRLAQQLYEAGHITYMRTDSMNLSADAIKAAEENVIREYGANYSNPRQYTTKNKSAQEAHEAIRPTNFDVKSAGKDDAEKRLYDLIWKRSISSQMTDAQLERTIIDVATQGLEYKFVAKGEVILFDGFLRIYQESQDDDDTEEDTSLLPKVQINETLEAQEIEATERFSRAPARYGEAALVKKLEELGIGRPSTYAPTISTIQQREYVEMSDLDGTEREFMVMKLKQSKITKKINKEVYGADKRKLIPTDIGRVVNDFLVTNFKAILDYKFTAKVEEEFDEIANGKIEWTSTLSGFYGDFHKNVEDVSENAERASGARLLGIDPASGKNVYARIGRYGSMIQIGETEDEEKPKFASLQKNQNIGSITFEEAMQLFDLPRVVGQFEEKDITVAVGRFGPYVRHDGKFVSLKVKEGDDPYTISLERSVELIQDKREADANKFINSFTEVEPEIQILNGRYGPYITQNKNNYKIPKDKEADKLTLEECLKIIAETPEKKTFKKGTTAKAATAKKAPAKKPATKKPAAKKTTPAKKKE